MACVFLARLIDYVVIFRRATKKAHRAAPSSPSYRKNRFFSIPQTIVKYRTDIRQPEKMGGLRKIEIAGNG
ncbi:MULTISPECIES: hypothetical protein [unclassified Burkholderia]|uniref:hypothetical protein n=1 Tax=unclassified Burkholderia TaxID=2613784 RepID=UPI000F58D912|nr:MULTISPECIES: hypothetical protein [unclassified Burkholderia]